MATRLSGRVRRLEQTRGTCPHCGGRGKVVVVHAQPELATRTPYDDTPVHGLADADKLPGCAGCGKQILVVIEYVDALPARCH